MVLTVDFTTLSGAADLPLDMCDVRTTIRPLPQQQGGKAALGVRGFGPPNLQSSTEPIAHENVRIFDLR
jgi:hypothetical protein